MLLSQMLSFAETRCKRQGIIIKITKSVLESRTKKGIIPKGKKFTGYFFMIGRRKCRYASHSIVVSVFCVSSQELDASTPSLKRVEGGVAHLTGTFVRKH
mmetsp:Transcript_38772/g.116531  ORF Transcript_38772/g.116531 Transcript_38772/m.116531 type:complete len:100 (+) Transcript_38772:516-815(+)